MRAPNSIARIRNLVAILLAVVLLLAPTLTRAGMISAVQPHHAHMMEQTGHCHIPPSDSGDSDKSAGKSCCISTCLAITNDAAAPSDNQPLQRAALTVPVTIFHVGFLGEIATPPPRPL